MSTAYIFLIWPYVFVAIVAIYIIGVLTITAYFKYKDKCSWWEAFKMGFDRSL